MLTFDTIDYQLTDLRIASHLIQYHHRLVRLLRIMCNKPAIHTSRRRSVRTGNLNHCHLDSGLSCPLILNTRLCIAIIAKCLSCTDQIIRILCICLCIWHNVACLCPVVSSLSKLIKFIRFIPVFNCIVFLYTVNEYAEVSAQIILMSHIVGHLSII